MRMLFICVGNSCRSQMAESIANYLSKNPNKKIIHFNGRFHSDEHLGTAQKLSILMPSLKIAVISIIPCEHKVPNKLIKEDSYNGDFIIYCPRKSEYKISKKERMFKHF
jgi:protein-tyrosine-phosphatase